MKDGLQPFRTFQIEISLAFNLLLESQGANAMAPDHPDKMSGQN